MNKQQTTESEARSRAFVVHVLVARHVVADVVVRLPAAEERESRSDLHLHVLVALAQVARRDVADLVTVVDVARTRRQQGL